MFDKARPNPISGIDGIGMIDGIGVIRAIREGLSALGAVDRSGWSSAARSAEVLELTAIVERAQAELVARVAEWNARGAWADDGALSAASWLAARTPTTRPAASRLVRAARLVHAHEQTHDALAAGEVAVAHVETLAVVARGRERLYAEHEATLLAAAGALVPDDFVTVAQRWRALADDELARLDAAAAFEGRHLHVSPTMGGGAISGFLDPEATAIVIAALDAMEPPDAADSVTGARSLPQRRADALVTLCEVSLSDAGRGRESVAAVDVVVDLDTLLGGRGRGIEPRTARAEILEHGVLARVAVERLLCDSPVGRVITRGPSETLDLGRRSRVANRAMRRSIRLRDGHCQFPSCRAPGRWCDVHHLVPWIEGGATDSANCVLLCRRHHVLLHEGGWQLQRGASGELTASRRPQRLRRPRRSDLSTAPAGRAPPRAA
jgi:hypothetical protein